MISTTILRHLIHNADFGKKVIPFLKREYFSHGEETIFQLISEYTQTYGEFPSLESVGVDLTNTKISDDQFQSAKDILVDVSEPEPDTSLDWLLAETEKFCQERAIDNALFQCINIKDGKDKKLSKGSIPQILADALAVSFDTHLGHDYFNDTEKQLDFYHDKRKRIPFGIDLFDEATRGGLLPKTLNMFLASTGVGKSLCMCSCAAKHLEAGYNVLYFTMEMAEEEIRKRLDADILNLDIERLDGIDRELYISSVEKLKGRTKGTLIVKEYPSGTPTIDHFQHFINELRLKKRIIPDIIYVDYLNICASNRVKLDGGSYGFIKSISQELRSMGQKNMIPIVSATQTNRQGYENSDIDMSVISESFGTGHEVDLLWGIMLPTGDGILGGGSLGQYKINQLKSRYADINKVVNGKCLKSFNIGVDKSKMRIYNLEKSAQTNMGGQNLMSPNSISPKKSFAEFY